MSDSNTGHRTLGALATLATLRQTEVDCDDLIGLSLLVAQEPCKLNSEDIATCHEQVEEWAAQLERLMPSLWTDFHKRPEYWDSDEDQFRVQCLCSFIGQDLGIDYISSALDYRDPDVIFLPGLIRNRRGTCVTMPLLLAGLGQYLGYPLKLVVAKDHVFVRWDNGVKRFNIEATAVESGQFGTSPDEDYIRDMRISEARLKTGSDLISLDAKQTLGLLLQIRGDHYLHLGRKVEARQDNVMSHYLFPANADILMRVVDALEERYRTVFPAPVIRLCEESSP